MNDKGDSLQNWRDVFNNEPRKRITLVKRKLGGLGFLVRRNYNSKPYIISVVKGGEAEARGVEVGSVIETGGLSYEQIVDKLARAPLGKPVTISFKTAVLKVGAKKSSRMDRNQGTVLEKGMNGSDMGQNENDMPPEMDSMEDKSSANGNGEVNGSADCDQKRREALGSKSDKKFIKLDNWISKKQTIDTLHVNAEVCLKIYFN